MLRQPSVGDVFVAGSAGTFLLAFRVADGSEIWLHFLLFWFLMLPFPSEDETSSHHAGQLSLNPEGDDDGSALDRVHAPLRIAPPLPDRHATAGDDGETEP